MDFRTARRMDGKPRPVPVQATMTPRSAMIEDLRQPITVEMVIQEINRYADSEFRYAGKSRRGRHRQHAVREIGPAWKRPSGGIWRGSDPWGSFLDMLPFWFRDSLRSTRCLQLW